MGNSSGLTPPGIPIATICTSSSASSVRIRILWSSTWLFDDPRAFTAPVRGQVIYGRSTDQEDITYSGPSVEYVQCEDRIYADQENEAWPFFGGEYPAPQFPPAGPEL